MNSKVFFGIAVLAWLIALPVLASPIARTSVKPILLVPIYVYPHSWVVNEYTRLVNVQKRHPGLHIVAIVNVDFDGTDWKTDGEYRGKMQDIVRSLDASGIAVIGYASSGYSRRPFQGDPKGSGFGSDFKTNVDRWTKFFPQVRGVFVDEMCYNVALFEGLEHPCLAVAESRAPMAKTTGRAYRDILAYYRTLYQYVRQTKGLETVITNPGQQVNIAFYDGSLADAIIVYEGSEAHFDPTVYPLGNHPDMTGLLLYNDPPFRFSQTQGGGGKGRAVLRH
ncbi:MAG: hypothetical protein C4332_08350 [Meiothermus sp.]